MAQSVVITEFMAKPRSGEAEWVEISSRTSEAVDLRDWTLHDRTRKQVAITDEEVLLAPGGRLVIAESYPPGTRWAIAPDSVLVLRGLPSLNNGGDDVVLADADGIIVDSVGYASSWLGKTGVSLERIRVDDGAEQENWAPCIDPTGATPGRRNSVAPPAFDLAITDARFAQDSIFITVTNAGVGIPSTAAYVVTLLHDDGPPETLLRRSFSSPPSGATAELRTMLTLPGTGRHTLNIRIDCPADSRPQNDSIMLSAVVPLARGGLLINEIMFEPLPSGCEWIELWNATAEPVLFDGFTLAGAAGSNGKRSRIPLPNASPAVPPAGYAVIAADSSILTRFPALRHPEEACVLVILNRTSLGLGNTCDEILLLDGGDRAVDSLRYDAEAHHPFLVTTAGHSLELIHPSLHEDGMPGWGSCTDAQGGTPGWRNSIHSALPPDVRDGDAQLSITPLPFSPDGDGFEDYCVITCTAPSAVNQARLRLFDVNGRLVRTLLSNAPAGRRISAVWDGLDDAGRRARIGPYVVLLELLDTSDNAVFAAKGIVVVAVRL